MDGFFRKLIWTFIIFETILLVFIVVDTIYSGNKIDFSQIKLAFKKEEKISEIEIIPKKELDEAGDVLTGGTFMQFNINESIKNRIMGKSYMVNENIALSDLTYLQMSYYGFDGKEHFGEMIVHKSIANEVLDIFSELYEIRFPIEKMVLVDDYDADDIRSMEANNTSAFNYRNIAGTNTLSRHALGFAIDVNPVQNPYVYADGNVMTPASKIYTDRTHVSSGMINKDDEVYQIFKKYGWNWGGDFSPYKDYQHFEKK